jgi:hypothetical protein
MAQKLLVIPQNKQPGQRCDGSQGWPALTTRSYETKEPTKVTPTKSVNTKSTQRTDCHHSAALGILKT